MKTNYFYIYQKLFKLNEFRSEIARNKYKGGKIKNENKELFNMYPHWFYHWCLMNDIPMKKFSDGKEEFKEKFLNYIESKEIK